ncbi:MAG: hypothetical protein ACI9YH_000920 [Colwellia sp.]|jgi:hypothetical protein
MKVTEKELIEIKDEIAVQYLKILPGAKKTVRNKLLFFITKSSNEYIQMGEDFVGNAVASLMAGFSALPVPEIEKSEFDKPKKVKTQEELDERQQRLLKNYKKEENYLIKYIHRSVINQCNVRQKRWSDDKWGVGKELKDDRTHDSEKEAAVRARHHKPQDYKATQEEWLVDSSSQLHVEHSTSSVIEADLMVALEESKITDEEQKLIFDLLYGYTYEEMAEMYGGKDEQYRYKLKLALAKLDLKPKDLKI